jgi:hypothetical protein
MTHLKMLGSLVRLPDGRTGHIAGSGLDGVNVICDGRVITVAAADLTAIPPPADPLPEPARIANPLNMAVLVSGKWSEPQ